MEKQKLEGKKRSIVGRKVKTLRRQGIIPANIYGRHTESYAVQVERKAFENAFQSAGETGIIEFSDGKTSVPVLIHNVQRHPVTKDVLHIDFLKVNLKEKITARVQISIKGEADAVRNKKGILLRLVKEIEVEALPTDLPKEIEINVSSLKQVDQSIAISEISVPASVKVLTDPEIEVVKIAPIVVEKEEPVAKEPTEEAAVQEQQGKEEKEDQQKEKPQSPEKEKPRE